MNVFESCADEIIFFEIVFHRHTGQPDFDGAYLVFIVGAKVEHFEMSVSFLELLLSCPTLNFPSPVRKFISILVPNINGKRPVFAIFGQGSLDGEVYVQLGQIFGVAEVDCIDLGRGIGLSLEPHLPIGPNF